MTIEKVSKAELARRVGVSRQNMEHRVKTGWKFGRLDGRRVMYNPKAVSELIGHPEFFDGLIEEQNKKGKKNGK